MRPAGFVSQAVMARRMPTWNEHDFQQWTGLGTVGVKALGLQSYVHLSEGAKVLPQRGLRCDRLD